ncbi:hypothetical protein [Burkholderia ubonensis]|uniref:hypothetical protein n=1 Tax=Burkholderia ubonensis TaxID=101571 RepID=UPI0012F95064|nr:hypothetical protein [Burkholderia ubonensis]
MTEKYSPVTSGKVDLSAAEFTTGNTSPINNTMDLSAGYRVSTSIGAIHAIKTPTICNNIITGQ